ncbi:CDP-glycerol--glycerophosphate glycerophosphotransferase [Bacillus wiedmannii]|uniref:CDP-glycerol glycerophosphotransferase family protein n=1 Tax=Bacillus cereus group TaxID=86661 RepID=UPI0008567FA9|nr:MULTISPECIES: CDP-glycerol glycerophosphotransferase family protein [Bacillus cereus group]PEC62658.1 CDP-glycerol--glycerophosphate glycerophosphotransferase [Bacillus wiedmannii]PEI39126.1 CDP-glycerol--glycerophosphate glycerophosphotransferase [Bacillus wiedmannii]PEN97283.1 CDP-glycerol--glycerophosphate glycerophosphotransferase [Bacillus wiedmannii]QWH69048.1 CDP-glycerol glycerophosphotransferase family protein [Bacillus wiedmannii]TXR67234.1 CDP-glycerol glycerophosphotransferase f
MIREIQIAIYLTIFRLLFNLFRVFPIQKKATFIMSYGENALSIYEEMREKKIDLDVVFLYKPTCKYKLKDYPEVKSYQFETLSIVNMIEAVYHLTTSKYVIIDNYFGFLSAIKFKEGTECIQLWHAAGSIKKFGLLDPNFNKRSKRAQKRFKRVYNNFHKIVVGSELLADIYMSAFSVDHHQMVRTGIPRTDLFFNRIRQEEIKKKLFLENPNLINKKVILYAPTFRDNEINSFKLQLEIEEMYREFHEEYVLFIRLHPAIKEELYYEIEHSQFIYDYSMYPNINDLFLVTDILITDYSSIPYEFCLLKKPMVFYPYDLEEYKKQRGIIGEYDSLVPGPVVYSTKELVSIINNNEFDLSKVEEFSLKWNQYSKGNSSESFIREIFKI